MGFEILPIEDGDENIYDVITITSPNRWIPHKFMHESPEEKDDEYVVNHTSHENSSIELKVLDESNPIIKM